jgi:hypothetical protein
MKIGGTELQHSYQFSFLKWGLINPSRPPFQREESFWGTKGDLTALQKAKVFPSFEIFILLSAIFNEI